VVADLPQAGGEVMLRNRELGHTPEDERRLQVPGMMAEDARATRLERHRRGQRHAAHAGSVHVLVAAPEGDRDLPQHHGGGPARDEMVAADARGVRQMFDGGGPERATIGDVCRRLRRVGEPPRTGKAGWERRVVWGLRRHPAYLGTAAFGKTRQGPRRQRVRAQRGRLLQPRRAPAPSDVPRAEWCRMPVPASVEPERFAAVPEPWQANQRHARH
jgi:site-specific DNA recombinase